MIDSSLMLPAFIGQSPLICTVVLLPAHFGTRAQRLGKEAAEAAGLRERGRDLAVETKRLAKEAEARQGRLEEARERGATAEEALRASKARREQGEVLVLVRGLFAGHLIASLAVPGGRRQLPFGQPWKALL